MNKFFAPIGRWHFFISCLLLCIINKLLLTVLMTYVINTRLEFAVFYTILVFLVSKRFFDIFQNYKKTIIYTAVLMAPLIIFAAVVFSFSELLFSKNIRLAGTIMMAYQYLLILFLSIKRGSSSKNSKFEIQKALGRLFTVFAIFYIYFLVCFNFYSSFFGYDGRMYPTIDKDANLLIQRIKKTNQIKRNDIVGIPIDPNSYSVYLRVVGLPNETVELKGKEIYINGELYDNKYAFYSKNIKSSFVFNEKIKLDNDSYLVMGDNRYCDIRNKIWTKVGSKKKNNIHYEWVPLKGFISYGEYVSGNSYLVVNKNIISGKIIGIYDEDFKKNKNGKIKMKYTLRFSPIKNEFGFKESLPSSKIFGTIEKQHNKNGEE